ncbi:MAG: DUF1232 domain-containing protein [Salinarimonas sp.]|nr:DUF1232 domain-containing protein [Salinarimonas sp.]
MVRIREAAKSLMRDTRLFLRMLADPRTPVAARLIAVFAVLYVIFPFDLIPDYVPIYGLIDDIIVVAIAIVAIWRMIPQAVMEQYRPPPPANDNGAAPRRGSSTALLVALIIILALTAAAWWGYGVVASPGEISDSGG